MTSVSSQGSAFWYCLKLRASDSDVGPMPSETMKTRLRLPDGFSFVVACFWYTTASTMTTAVATRAQANKPSSLHLFHPVRGCSGCFPVRWPVSRASSSARSRSLECSDDGRCDSSGRAMVGGDVCGGGAVWGRRRGWECGGVEGASDQAVAVELRRSLLGGTRRHHRTHPPLATLGSYAAPAGVRLLTAATESVAVGIKLSPWTNAHPCGRGSPNPAATSLSELEHAVR